MASNYENFKNWAVNTEGKPVNSVTQYLLSFRSVIFSSDDKSVEDMTDYEELESRIRPMFEENSGNYEAVDTIFKIVSDNLQKDDLKDGLRYYLMFLKSSNDVNPINRDYDNFFQMLKFWIRQTNHNIEDAGKKVRFQEISELNTADAEKKFRDPQFKSEYINYANFSVRISFFRSGQYKGEKVNFVVWKPEKDYSWWLNIRYIYSNQTIIASYRGALLGDDPPRFKDYMASSDYGKDLSFTVDELDLTSDAPNDRVKELFDFYSGMIKYAKKYIEAGVNNVKVQELASKLKKAYNIILRGAPGTGKTYLAQQTAAMIISGGRTDAIDRLRPEQQKQLGFVQFHPSYDYTDFVEGLRPTNSTDGIGFKLEAGVFKKFVERASTSTNDVDNFDEAWDRFVEKMEDEQEITVAPGYTYHPSKSWESAGGIMRIMERHSQYINKDQLYKVYRGLKGVPMGGHDNFRRKVILFMKEELGLLDYKQVEGVNDDPYVFIIDEINRGEISKIFGELFFSLDPGYRGTKGGVFTQYANLHVDPEEKFYIPKNVYIIGTMNDIDRSVDTFDFAMRRRFTFLEVTAEESAENMNLNPPLKRQMARLNLAIVKEGGLTEDYQIGASYFGDIDAPETDETNAPLWDTKLYPLLKDYFRGEHKANDKLDKIKKEYFAIEED